MSLQKWEANQQADSTRVESKRSVQVGETAIGKGVFASRSFPTSAVIGQITGQVINDPEYTSDYCIELTDWLSLEPSAPFRFLNHSCEPNCEFDFDVIDHVRDGSPIDVPHVFVFALRDITEGEELTIDYNWPASHAIPCECGAVSCRGWVVGEDEMFG